MYLDKEGRKPHYEFVIEALRKGIIIAVGNKDKSHVTYVLMRAAVLAWENLGGGYNNGSDIKAIFADVLDEMTARVSHSLKKKREKYGDINHPIKLPDLDTLDIKRAAPPIVDKEGKTLSTEKPDESK